MPSLHEGSLEITLTVHLILLFLVMFLLFYNKREKGRDPGETHSCLNIFYFIMKSSWYLQGNPQRHTMQLRPGFQSGLDRVLFNMKKDRVEYLGLILFLLFFNWKNIVCLLHFSPLTKSHNLIITLFLTFVTEKISRNNNCLKTTSLKWIFANYLFSIWKSEFVSLMFIWQPKFLFWLIFFLFLYFHVILNKKIFIFFFIDFDGYYIVRTDEGQPRPKYIFINVELTSTFLLYRGLVHHHHRFFLL